MAQRESESLLDSSHFEVYITLMEPIHLNKRSPIMGRAKAHLIDLEYQAYQALSKLTGLGITECCELHDIYYTEQVYDDSLLDEYDFSEISEDREALKEILEHALSNIGDGCHICIKNAHSK
jgi:hypothetical protein